MTTTADRTQDTGRGDEAQAVVCLEITGMTCTSCVRRIEKSLDRVDGTPSRPASPVSCGRPVFAMPGTTFGPVLTVHVQFDSAGTYQLWGQFRTADGDVLTAPFSVVAR